MNVFIPMTIILMFAMLLFMLFFMPILTFPFPSGIQGELKAVVKLEYLGDVNPFQGSSFGVQFLSRTSVPPGHRVQLLTFIEELMVAEDPEAQWMDNFRPARDSNQARLHAFNRLSGRVRNRIGRKVRETGGNAVIGFRLSFDIERGLVVRGVGTVCRLSKDDPYVTFV